jgi:phage terminase large subunit GpA-like protein
MSFKTLLASLTRIVKVTVAGLAKPPPRMTLSEWAAEYRFVPADVSANPGPWRNELFPFLVEIMDCLDPRHPAEKVTFSKSAQVGGTEVLINWLGAIAHIWPGPTLAVQPTVDTAQDWVREKLAPTIRATPVLTERIAEQKSRDGVSTTLFKSFRGGYWVLTGANSAAKLSSKSIRYIAKDEWDRWPEDVDGQGDPDSLVEARQTSYHASGRGKTLQVSTPANASSSRINHAYEAGDRRRYHVPCPQCGHMQILRFRSPHADKRGGLMFDTRASDPGATAVYICEAAGCVIEHWQKREMIARGRWISTLPEEQRAGKQPSFHINALYSPVTTWRKMVEAFLAAKDDPQKLKAFTNLWLGEAWEEKGEAPEVERLLSRRESYAARVIPRGGLLIFAAADVQQNGIFYEAFAVGRDLQTWSFDADFIEGDTADADGEVWKLLRERWDAGWFDSFGNRRGADAEGIDTGYNSNAAYNFARSRPRCKALKGEDGWHKAALGSPNKIDFTYRGKRRRGGVMLWLVGTWSLKSALYSALALPGVKEGEPVDPPGYCHFTETLHGKPYFEQLTAESLKKTDKHGKPLLKNGRPVSKWESHGANHFHDCRIYGMALADHYGVGNFTADRWAEIAADRERAPVGAQGDLLAAMNAPVAPKPVTAAALPETQTQPTAQPTAPATTQTAAERLLARLTGKH